MTSSRRRLGRRLGCITLAAAVIVPGAALAQNADRDRHEPASAAQGAVHPTGAITADAVAYTDMVASDDPAPTTADDEATRAELATYLDELQAVVDGEQFAPAGQPQLPVAASDFSGAVTAASSLVD
ncbi:MAG TPA: hypothetical protein VMQ81_11195, partial [Acidimicrobiia bacterium]|nr:hypothetical protein [Acidimicrobiia bacterium]